MSADNRPTLPVPASWNARDAWDRAAAENARPKPQRRQPPACERPTIPAPGWADDSEYARDAYNEAVAESMLDYHTCAANVYGSSWCRVCGRKLQGR